MAELLNIRFSFSCRISHNNQEGKSPVILRIAFRKERRDIFTGLYILSSNWDRQQQRISKDEPLHNSLNQNLTLILRKAIDAFDELRFSRNPFTIDELVDKIRGRESKPSLLIEFLEEGLRKIKKKIGTEIIQVTYSKYKRSVTYLKDFIQKEYKIKNCSLQKINQEFIEQYFQFLRNDKDIAHNTACKYIQYIKTLLLPALRNGLIKTDPFYRLKISPKPVYREILSQEEIDMI